MSRLRFLAVLLVLSATSLLRADLSPTDEGRRILAKEIKQGFREGSVLAKPKKGVDEGSLRSHENAKGAKLRRRFSRMGAVRALEFSANQDVGETIESLRASGLYEYVEPNYLRHALVTPNDPRFSEQWALNNTGQNGGTAGADIKAPAAWNLRTGAGDVIVAVLDTGVRATHEDLAANLWVNPKETSVNGADDDGNGYVDDVHGMYSRVAPGAADSGDIADKVGHGTAVASVIAASGNNGKGISGVAWSAKLMICRMADNGGQAAAEDILESVDYAVANGAKIINISFGGTGYSRAEYDSMKRARDAGVIIVAAAGNDGVSDQVSASYPASIPLENIVSVANTTSLDALAPSSVYGGLVELGAPGTDILACSKDSDTSYASVNGTSFSAPMVSGSLALLAAQFPNDTYRQLINRLLRSVDKLPSLAGKVQTGGRLNVSRALSSAAGENRPFNDDFANRARIDGESFNSRGVTIGATVEPGEPTHGAPGGTSLWWTWTAPHAGTVLLDTNTSTFDTTLAVYTGSVLSSLTQVAANDDAPGRLTSRLSFTAASGTTYQIAIDGKNGSTGFAALALGFAPPNDDFANAVSLSGVTGKMAGNNRSATAQSGEPIATTDYGNGQGKTVWYTWTAPKSGSFTFSAATHIFSPVISVYTGSSVAALTLVKADTHDCTFSALAAVTYRICIDTANTETGTFTLTYNEGFTIFLGGFADSSADFTPDRSLIALWKTGKLVHSDGLSASSWVDDLVGDPGVSVPAVASDGTIYITTSTSLYAIARDKTHKWTKDYDKGVGSSPTISREGNIIVHTNDGYLRAFGPTGNELWSTVIAGESYSSPSIARDGTVYIGSTDHNLYAVNASNGSIKWKYDTGGEIYASPAIGADGTVYLGNLDSKFFAISASGALSWQYTVGNSISSSAAIGTDGTLYFGCYDAKLYAVSSSGALKWTYTTGGEIRASSPAVSADGTVYIGSYDGILYAVSSAGVLSQKFTSADVIRSSPLLLANQVIFGSEDGRFYVSTVTSGGVAKSNWPMHRQNGSRTGRAISNTAPSITAQPSSTVVAIGGSTTLTVNADGQDPMTYQWYFNGAAIPGANQASYTISNASDASAGNYTVVITNALGSVTSGAASVSVATASNIGRIVNLSARAVAGTDASTLIVGLVIGSGQGTKPLLIRGVGATLAQAPYNVSGVLQDPSLRLFPAGASTFTASNDDWGTDSAVPALMARTGAFTFLSAKDSAMSTDLPSGGYTVHVTSTAANSTAGVALAEFYDATEVFTAATPRLVNISARSHVGQGGDVLILGFVIGGSTPVKVLIRAIGPTLSDSRFNVAGALSDPKLTLRKQGASDVLQENDNWGSASNGVELQAAMLSTGAFSIPSDSKDAAIVVTLEPGAYTAVISGVNNAVGVGLGEVYVVN